MPEAPFFFNMIVIGTFFKEYFLFKDSDEQFLMIY